MYWLFFQLFVGQYHIWLAQDTKGILVLIPGQPFLNVIVTTFIFVCICHEVHKVSAELTKAMISNDITTLLRRLFISIIALIIIWWHKTHHTMKPRLYWRARADQGSTAVINWIGLPVALVRKFSKRVGFLWCIKNEVAILDIYVSPRYISVKNRIRHHTSSPQEDQSIDLFLPCPLSRLKHKG